MSLNNFTLLTLTGEFGFTNNTPLTAILSPTDKPFTICTRPSFLSPVSTSTSCPIPSFITTTFLTVDSGIIQLDGIKILLAGAVASIDIFTKAPEI